MLFLWVPLMKPYLQGRHEPKSFENKYIKLDLIHSVADLTVGSLIFNHASFCISMCWALQRVAVFVDS